MPSDAFLDGELEAHEGDPVALVRDLEHDQLVELVTDLTNEVDTLERRLEAHSNRFESNEQLWRDYLDAADDETLGELRERAIARRRTVTAETVDHNLPESKVEICRQVAKRIIENSWDHNGAVLESAELADRVQALHGFSPDARTVNRALEDVGDANDQIEHVTGKPGPGAPYNRIRAVSRHNSREL